MKLGYCLQKRKKNLLHELHETFEKGKYNYPGGECIDSKNVYLIALIAVKLQKILEEKLNIEE